MGVAECGGHKVWGMQSVGVAVCEGCRVWGLLSVGIADCGIFGLNAAVDKLA